jgi:hypothetical protein
MKFFNKTADQVNVLLVDAHPRGQLDGAWSTLFNSSRQLLSLVQGRTLFTDLVWGILGYNSQLRDPQSYRDDPPYVDEFHRFVLDRHGVPDPDSRKLDCGNVSVLFIWRRDYLAHPRNPTGKVQRKIANEDELVEAISRYEVVVM